MRSLSVFHGRQGEHDGRGGGPRGPRSRARRRSTSPDAGLTKLDLVRVLPARWPTPRCTTCASGPTMLKRCATGIEGEVFFQKRVPKKRPGVAADRDRHVPVGPQRHRARAPTTPRTSLWAVNLGDIDFNPWPARRADLDHPDELRIDLDPTPEATWDDVREVAMCVKDVLERARAARLPEDLGLAWHPRLRADRAELAGSPRSAARRWRWPARSSGACPARRPRSGGRRSASACSSTTTRTRATAPWPSAYSVRPVPDARVSCPVRVGRGARRRDRATCASTPSRRGCARRATPAADIDDATPARSRRSRAGAPRRGARPRRRAVAAALRQADGRAQASAAEQGEEGL